VTEPFNVLQSYHDLRARMEALEAHLRLQEGTPEATGNRQEAPAPAPTPAPKDFKCALAKEMLARFEKQGQFETEGFGFAQELVSQYGGDYIDDDATIFKISAKDLYVLMRIIGYSHSGSKGKLPPIVSGYPSLTKTFQVSRGGTHAEGMAEVNRSYGEIQAYGRRCYEAGVVAGAAPFAMPHAFTRTQISSACIRAGLSAPELEVVRSKLEEIAAEELSRVPD